MTLKAKLFSTIAAFCLVAVLMIVGVFAASSVSVNMSGKISFTANDVVAIISGTVTGTKDDSTAQAALTNIKFTGSEAEDDSENVKSWNGLEWSFADKTSGSTTGIVFVITVHNDHTENNITSTLTIGDLETTLAAQNVTVTVATSGTDSEGSATAAQTIAKGAEITYTFTFKIANTNKSVDIANWADGVSINLADAGKAA